MADTSPATAGAAEVATVPPAPTPASPSFPGLEAPTEDASGSFPPNNKLLGLEKLPAFSAAAPKPAAAPAVPAPAPMTRVGAEPAPAEAEAGGFSNLIVNYLPNDCAEDELRQLFVVHGEIETTKVVRDRATGISCGYGFVKFLEHEAAAAALRGLQGFGLRGKRLKVSVALGPGRGLSAGEYPQNNLIVNYLTHDMTEDRLLGLFAGHGEVESVKIVRDRDTGMSLCYGFVKFTADEGAARAVAALNGLDMGTKRLKVSVARPASAELRHNKLYVSYLPKTYSKDDVTRLFQRFGRVLECRLLYHDSGESRCTAFVHMATKQAAEAALVLHGVQLQHTTRGMVVKMAHNKTGLRGEVALPGPAPAPGPPMYFAPPAGPVHLPGLSQQLQGLRLGAEPPRLPAYAMHPAGAHVAPSPAAAFRGSTPLKSHGYDPYFPVSELGPRPRLGMPYGTYTPAPHAHALPTSHAPTHTGGYGTMSLRPAPASHLSLSYGTMGYGNISTANRGGYYTDRERAGEIA